MGLSAVLLVALLAVGTPLLAPTQVEAATFFGALETKLIASDAATGDQFGYSMAISGDTAVVGACLNDDAGEASGSAYLYEAVITELDLLAARVEAVETGLTALGDKVNTMEGNLSALETRVNSLESSVNEIEAMVKKADVEVVLQLPTKDYTIYHLETSMGG